MRRCLMWLLVVPLAVAASQCAHWLAYRLAVPDASLRSAVLAESGHGYLDQAPLVAGIGIALVLAVLAARAASAARGEPSLGSVARWPFALVPLFGFVAQEHIERLVHDGVVPLHTYADRSFLIGVALQVPFGALAYLLARVLLTAAHRLGRALAGSPVITCAGGMPGTRPVTACPVRRASPLALDGAGRAPPGLLCC